MLIQQQKNRFQMRKKQMSARFTVLANNLPGGLPLLCKEFKAAIEENEKLNGINKTCKTGCENSLLTENEGV